MGRYYIHDGKEQRGPFDIEGLQVLGISRDTVIWHEGLEKWTKAGDIEELRVLFPVFPQSFVYTDTEHRDSIASAFERKRSTENRMKAWSNQMVWISGGIFILSLVYAYLNIE